jgi:hypothetical protein
MIARLFSQGRLSMPNVRSIFSQFRTEFAGRATGVGYSAVVMGKSF